MSVRQRQEIQEVLRQITARGVANEVFLISDTPLRFYAPLINGKHPRLKELQIGWQIDIYFLVDGG